MMSEEIRHLREQVLKCQCQIGTDFAAGLLNALQDLETLQAEATATGAALPTAARMQKRIRHLNAALRLTGHGALAEQEEA